MTDWNTRVLLKGSCAVGGNSYPLEWTRTDSDTQEVVVYVFSEPRHVPTGLPVDISTLEQEVQLNVTASANRVVELVEEAVAEVVSCMSFLGSRAVEYSIGPINTQDQEVTEGAPYKQLLMTSKAGMIVSPALVPAEHLSLAVGSFGRLDPEACRSVIRALRWLGRSRLESDDIDAFIDLAISLESLIPALRRQPLVKAALQNVENPTSAAVLRCFALSIHQMSEDLWKTVGTNRNALFHGGLPDNDQTRAELTTSIPAVRTVVKEGIRAVLGLPTGVPPDNPFDTFGMSAGPVSFTPSP